MPTGFFNISFPAMTRTTFTVSRAAEFFFEKELQMQMGAGLTAGLPMLRKALIDNPLDASKGAGALSYIEITATDVSISVSDNGPGIPANTVVDPATVTGAASSSLALLEVINEPHG